MATREGKAIRFCGEDVRTVGRASRGVSGIRMSGEDSVIGMQIIRNEPDTTILSVCEKGYGKRTALEEYRTQSRGGKGIFTIKVTERNGPVVGIAQVRESDDLMIMTSSGKLTRFNMSDIGVIGRVTQGVRLMNITEEEKVIGFARVPAEQDLDSDETLHMDA